MTADGVWTYKLDNANCEVQALNDCDTLTDCFKVTTIDGTAQLVTITINGADDTFHFKDKMSDVKTSDVIDLAGTSRRRSVPPKTLQEPVNRQQFQWQLKRSSMSARNGPTLPFGTSLSDVTTRAPHDLMV